MPIRIVDGFADPRVVEDATEEYIIFYSSVVDGKMWCPDCRDVEGLVEQAFGGADSPSALIVYVGNQAQWRSPTSSFRSGAWKITSVPTIIQMTDGAETSRLVEGAIASGLPDLLKSNQKRTNSSKSSN